jgi:putative nucleotidyltransferase with HDIG domain
MIDAMYSPAFWWLHVAGAFGVLGACVGMVVSKRMSRSTQDILAPVLVRDPLAAFELGLSPLVHSFVADLENKDEITRDHVVRTSEMAIRVGERFQLSGTQLRNLGLAAMLHDVGKLHVPDEILTKPSELTVEEYETVKRHVVHGAEMLRADSTLAAAADIVRSHHERVDGGGYPDGLSGNDIPLAARIIAVCDAFDAMTHDRQYRDGVSVKMAFAVLQANSGTQWDAEVIRQMMAVFPSMPAVSALDEVGRHTAAVVTTDDGIPDDIAELLAIVDAEI